MARAKHSHETPIELPAADSDEWVEVYPEAGMASDTARALLQSARDHGLDEQRAVVSISGGFRVPQAVLDGADIPTEPTPDPVRVATPLDAVKQGATPVDADASE